MVHWYCQRNLQSVQHCAKDVSFRLKAIQILQQRYIALGSGKDESTSRLQGQSLTCLWPGPQTRWLLSQVLYIWNFVSGKSRKCIIQFLIIDKRREEWFRIWKWDWYSPPSDSWTNRQTTPSPGWKYRVRRCQPTRAIIAHHQ